MGQRYSAPRNGTKLRVIGAGLPRTGTASFTRALEILLGGPVYHGGTQVTLGPEAEIRGWISLLSQWPAKDEGAQQSILRLLRERTLGYAAVTDSPGCGLVPELMQLYPDAVVICTVRDAASWEKSMAGVASASTKWFLRVVLLPVPSMRYFVDYINGLRDAWYCAYGETEPPTRQSWERHMQWLKETVPAERLVFFDVRDGWEPLCKALDLPVPVGVPFPQINDGKAIEEFATKQITRGLVRWAAIAGAVSVLGIVAAKLC
ncbi:uncharacterized protein LMH87_008686 [Akanthomyces muscarius]|uniref:NAD dependent epimerase/dehydratase n=1 Tax=Akanthomyces muscarius TaxID=2231603 RepID=A0A9W8QJP4_AKAMU|nr:uncharacterized protein LMH87_008686 [Akanthomyces muscarius]KAJ4158147.1 hypothetical protein LMH87_008686 [Akanthomyces muscarius]